MEPIDLLIRMVAHDPIALKMLDNHCLNCGLSLRRFGCGDDDRDHGCCRDGVVADRPIAFVEAR